MIWTFLSPVAHSSLQVHPHTAERRSKEKQKPKGRGQGRWPRGGALPIKGAACWPDREAQAHRRGAGSRDPTGFGERSPCPQLRPAASRSLWHHGLAPLRATHPLQSKHPGAWLQGQVFAVPAAVHFGSSSPHCLPVILQGAQGGPACTMNMNLWLLTCLVAVFVGAWVPTVCSQGTILGHTCPAP